MTTTSTVSKVPYLSSTQIRTFDEQGYLVLPNVLSRKEVEHFRGLIIDMIPRDLNFPERWVINAGRIKPYHEGYGEQQDRRGHEDTGIYDTPELLPLMCNETVYRAAVDLLDSTNLRVEDGTIGVTIRNDFAGEILSQPLHIDSSVPTDVPNFLFTKEERRVGGCFYLTDVEPTGGGTYVVPGGHKLVEERARAHGAGGRQLYDNWLDITDFPEPIEVTGQAGDYVMTHYLLPHAASNNRSGRTRVAYFTRYGRMDHPHYPPQPAAPNRFNFRQINAMGDLGRKLLGVDTW
jgi:ectoine hydroxylase-related dioxygenase (phytanoyl-CoA dioxygenase family)